MHLDDDEVDLASHVCVRVVTIRSHVSSDDLSSCTVHAAAAAVSSQRSSVIGENDGISGFMSYGFYAPMTFCGLPPGLVELQCLDESQMQWS